MILIGVTQRFVGGQRQISRAGVTVPGLFGHAARDHRVEGLGDAGANGAGLRDGIHHVRGDQHAGAVGAIGRAPGQALVQHARQSIDVGAVGDFVVGKPFRRHVFPGSHRGAQLGQLLVGGGAGDAEVDQVGKILAGNQDVLRFHIAMHHARGVGRVQRGGNLGDDRYRAWRGQGAEALEDAVQVGALDQAHLQEHLPVDFAVVVDRHHVGFLQPAGDAGFALHALPKHRIAAEGFRHQLDRDGPLFDGVLGLVDFAHPATAQQPRQAVGPERGPHSRALRVAHR